MSSMVPHAKHCCTPTVFGTYLLAPWLFSQSSLYFSTRSRKLRYEQNAIIVLQYTIANLLISKKEAAMSSRLGWYKNCRQSQLISFLRKNLCRDRLNATTVVKLLHRLLHVFLERLMQSHQMYLGFNSFLMTITSQLQLVFRSLLPRPQSFVAD